MRFDVQLALSCGRADYEQFLDELSHEEYETIHALRGIEFVGHEREDWRAACVCYFIVKAMSGSDVDPADILRMIQSEPEEKTFVKPEKAIAMTRRISGGDVRRPGGQAQS